MPFGIEGRSTSELIEEALALYARTEPLVRAFAWLDEERARKLAGEVDALPREQRERLRLCGVPVGIKDIVDTAGIPTECGSALFAGRVPKRTAPLVQRLEDDGALIIGKTVTTECAYFHPGPTRNPWDVRRTSGGSSMGSAAAVAMGLIPAAIGSQTNGSVIRPAAYCGVVGFKPTHGRISTDGVLAFAPTLDTIGTLTRSAADAARLCAVMTGEPIHEWWDPSNVLNAGGDGVLRVRLAAVRTAEWSHAEPAMCERFEADLAALSGAGAEITEETLPDGMDECVPVHRTIMQYESNQSLGQLIEARPEKASDTLRDYVRAGAAIPRAQYEAALRERDRLVAAFTEWAAQFDAIVTPPATGEAPTPETTGDPRFCTRWTLVGAPAVTIPTGVGPTGLPLGLQLVGAPGADRRTLRTAAWAEYAQPKPRWNISRLEGASR